MHCHGRHRVVGQVARGIVGANDAGHQPLGVIGDIPRRKADTHIRSPAFSGDSYDLASRWTPRRDWERDQISVGTSNGTAKRPFATIAAARGKRRSCMMFSWCWGRASLAYPSLVLTGS